MVNQIYVIYNKLSNRYGNVFSFETDAICRSRLGSKEAKFNHDELEVCKVGTIDISTGVVESLPPERIEIPRHEETLPVEESK